jgi:hypothetical protein
VLKNYFFAGILKVNDENSRIQIQDPDPNPDPDPLVRGMDPRIRIRIRIHPKMSWIRNTGFENVVYSTLAYLNKLSSVGGLTSSHSSKSSSPLSSEKVMAVSL